MSSYSSERKEAILSKLLPPHNKSVRSVATEEGMVEQTLYSWRKQAIEQGQPVPGKKSTPDQWSHETKFAVVVATATLSESELGEYCRKMDCILSKSSNGSCNVFMVFSAMNSTLTC
jgi:transposase-like protein